MSTRPNLSNSELLRCLTPEMLHTLDDDTISRLANYLRDEEHDRLEALCREETACFDSGVLYWLTNLTETENPQHEAQGLPFRAPFPRKGYFVPLFGAFLKKYEALFIPKSRTMLTSWSAMGFAAHRGQFFREETVVQTANQDRCEHLINYVDQLWNNQPQWLKDRHPLSRRSLTTIAWVDGGEVSAVPSGADKTRGFHATWYMQDESAHLPEGEECVNVVRPSGARIICISSAGPGWFAHQCAR